MDFRGFFCFTRCCHCSVGAPARVRWIPVLGLLSTLSSHRQRQAHGNAHRKITLQRSCLRWSPVEGKAVWFLARVFQATPSHHIRWFFPQVLQFSRTPQCVGREGFGHLSSGALPGTEAHPLPTQGLSGICFGQTGTCSYGKAVAFLPTMSRQLLEVFQPGLASLLQRTHSASHTTTCRDQLTQSFNLPRHFKNNTKQNIPKILIYQVAKAEDVQPGERAIAESSSSFSCSSKNHLLVWVMVVSREHQCRARRRQLWRK